MRPKTKTAQSFLEQPRERPGRLGAAPERVTVAAQRVEQLELTLNAGAKRDYDRECNHIASIYDNEKVTDIQRLYILERVLAGQVVVTADVVRLRKTQASDAWLKAEGLL